MKNKLLKIGVWNLLLAMKFAYSPIFAQSSSACENSKSSADSIKIEQIDDALRSSKNVADADTETQILRLRKIYFAISKKKEALNRHRAQIIIDEASLHLSSDQLESQLAELAGGPEKAKALMEEWNQFQDDAKRAEIAEFLDYRGLMESLLSVRGMTQLEFQKGKRESMEFIELHPYKDGRPIEMGKTEVTELQYFLVMGEKSTRALDRDREDFILPNQDKQSFNLIEFNGNRPASLTPTEAIEFVKKLNGLDPNYAYRIPSRTEWGTAANTDLSDLTEENIDEFAVRNSNTTAQVASLKPNRLGFYDVFGNAPEWCRDGEEILAVGGCWSNHRLRDLTSSPDYSRPYSGLRLVRTKK